MSVKVNELGSINQMIRQGTGVEKSGDPSVKNFTFQGTMADISEGNVLQKLGDLNVRIEAQAKVLGKRCDILELKRYKEMIAEFMYEAVQFAFQFKKRNTLDARGRHRVHAVIKKINEKLEELTRTVLSEQKDQLTVMDAIDEIRGMLLDLYM